MILRPGVIYGRDNLWTARLGIGGQGKRLWLRTGAWARLPLTYVENCADAIVTAAERAGRGVGQGADAQRHRRRSADPAPLREAAPVAPVAPAADRAGRLDGDAARWRAWRC